MKADVSVARRKAQDGIIILASVDKAQAEQARKALFETKRGQQALARLERVLGLALVPLEMVR